MALWRKRDYNRPVRVFTYYLSEMELKEARIKPAEYATMISQHAADQLLRSEQ